MKVGLRLALVFGLLGTIMGGILTYDGATNMNIPITLLGLFFALTNSFLVTIHIENYADKVAEDVEKYVDEAKKDVFGQK